MVLKLVIKVGLIEVIFIKNKQLILTLIPKWVAFLILLIVLILWQLQMKKIKIKIEDDVYKSLKQATQVKGMTGNIGGIVDSFIIKLIESVDKGLDEEHFKYKNKS